MVRLLGVFFFMTVSSLTAHHWFDVPTTPAGAIGIGFWPIVEQEQWLMGLLWYVMMVAIFSGF